MTPEKLPTSGKYFSTELSPHGTSGAVFFCAWTLLKIWPIDTHLSFRKSAKDPACQGLSKMRSPPKCFWRSVLRVSTVHLGGEGFCNKFIGFANLKKAANRKSAENFSSIFRLYLSRSFDSLGNWIVNFSVVSFCRPVGALLTFFFYQFHLFLGELITNFG